MKAKFVQNGPNIDWLNNTGDDVAAGDTVVMLDIVGFAAADIADGETGTVMIGGIFEVDFAPSSTHFPGKKILWDASTSRFTSSATLATGDVANCAVAVVRKGVDETTSTIMLTPGVGTYTA